MPRIPRRRLRRVVLATLLLLAAAWGVLLLTTQASNDRHWAPDQAQLPLSHIDGDRVTVRNVRNATYRSTSDFDVRWEERSYDLRRIESLWFVIEPFSDWRGPAHTFVSFGFDDGSYVAVSVEIRKEIGESFSPVGGMLRQYELMYVVGDERDLIGLRANHRHDDVYLYPVRATPAQARRLFVAMLERANAVAQAPEFYNTVTNNCTSNIIDHVNLLATRRIGWSYRTLLPAFADDLAYDLGLIDTALPRDSFRDAHRINTLAAKAEGDPAFSTIIRQNIVRGGL